MLIVPALEYEKQRQQPADWNKVILHREGKFYRTYEWSLWLIKKFVCTEEFQKQRGDDKMLSAKRYVGKKTGEYAMSGFPVESLSKYIPEYQAVRPMEGGDDLEVTINLPLQGDETYDQLFAQFGEWKQSLGMYEPDDKKGGRGKDAKPRGGAFAIVSKLLAYPVERKSSSENVESSVRLLQTEQRQERKQRPPAAFNVQGFCWRRVRQVVIVKLDIFFPASGNYNGTSLNNRGSNGNYWSSSYNSATKAYNLNFNSSNVNPANNNNRRYGFTARAVQHLPGTRYGTGNRTT